MEIEVVAAPTGSGTDEYGVDSAGNLWARGYGERHGRSFSGRYGVVVSCGEWRLVCGESRDWRGIVRAGGSLYAYLAARDRGLSHESAMASDTVMPTRESRSGA